MLNIFPLRLCSKEEKRKMGIHLNLILLNTVWSFLNKVFSDREKRIRHTMLFSNFLNHQMHIYPYNVLSCLHLRLTFSIHSSPQCFIEGCVHLLFFLHNSPEAPYCGLSDVFEIVLLFGPKLCSYLYFWTYSIGITLEMFDLWRNWWLMQCLQFRCPDLYSGPICQMDIVGQVLVQRD